MTLKNLYVSTAVLAVLAAITYFVKNADDSGPQDSRVGRHPLYELNLNDVSRIRIQTSGETHTLVQNEDNTGWLLEEKHSLPANLSTLTGLVQQLRDSRIERVASSNPDRIAELGFDDQSITFLGDSGKALLTLELGRQTDNGKQLIKYGDEDRAFIVNDQFNPAATATAWLDKTLLEVERDEILAATFEFPDAEALSVSRESADADWTTDQELPEGKELDQGAVTRALNRFATVNFTDIAPLDDPDALAAAEHERQFSFSVSEGPTYRVTLAQRPEVKVTKEVETTNEDGETVTEMQEEVETPAGPVFITIRSSDISDPINKYMGKTAYKVGSFLLSNLPKTRDALFRDKPEPPPAPEEAAAETESDASTPSD